MAILGILKASLAVLAWHSCAEGENPLRREELPWVFWGIGVAGGGTGRRTQRRPAKRFRRLTVPEPLEDRALPGGSLLELLLGAPLVSPFFDSLWAHVGRSRSDDLPDIEARARNRTSALRELLANPHALEQTVAEVRNLVQIASSQAQAADAQGDAFPGSEGEETGAGAGDFPGLERWWDDPGWLGEFEAVLRELSRAGSRFEFDSLGGPVLEQPGGPEVPQSELGDPVTAGDFPGELPVEGDPGGGGGMATLDYGGGYGGNEPPVAGNDQAYCGIDGGVTIFVLGNDYDPDGDEFSVTAVSQPAHGSAAVGYGGGSVVYTPEPGYTSGNDTFQYTVTDEHGASSQATVTVSRVQVTGFTLQRETADGGWAGVQDVDVSWSHDTLEWTAQYAPSGTPGLTLATWLKKEWTAPDEPDNWSEFAARIVQPARANPLMGDWAIRPKLCFTPPGQTPFWVKLATPKHRVDAQIATVDWTSHQANPAQGGELAPDAASVRIYPDATAPGGAARTKVDVLVHVYPHLAAIPVLTRLYDVDDPDMDGPIDTDPPQQGKNDPDNLEAGGGITPLPPLPASGSTDANGDVLLTLNVQAIQPGNNFRVAAGGHADEVDRVKALNRDTSARLFYDKDNLNDLFNAGGGDVIMDQMTSYRGIRATEQLIVWRKLRVEVDSMDVPPQTVTFPDDGKPIDVHPGDVPAPDTELLQQSFRLAFVQPVFGTPYDEDKAPFVYHASGCEQASRGIGESFAYWAAYIMGAYEPIDYYDGDPDNEELGFVFGGTDPFEPEVSFVFHEVLRDAHNDGRFPLWAGVYSQDYHERQAVVHEIGHHFELYQGVDHPPAGYSIMSNPEYDPPTIVIPPDSFAEDERWIIRTTFSV